MLQRVAHCFNTFYNITNIAKPINKITLQANVIAQKQYICKYFVQGIGKLYRSRYEK